ncbi:MAG: hypothetical protein K2W94_04290 [Alphaproteobacteria bacterium]|nr:hypothetical protein [Alphaproteobacteria bacterium]
MNDIPEFCKNFSYGRWVISFCIQEKFYTEYSNLDRKLSMIEQLRHILSFLTEEVGFLTVGDRGSEQFLQTTYAKEISHDKKPYYVEYRPPNKEILYGSVENLSLEKVLHLFEMIMNQDPNILSEIEWKDTGFL